MSIPKELTSLPRWVCHRAKIPFQVNGSPAKSNDPATWTTFDAACAATGFDGVGFVLGDGVAGVDLDRCYDEAGDLDAKSAAIVKRLDSYSERSPSGRGIHIIVKADVAHAVKTAGVEIYGNGRYFTMTADHLDGTPCTVESRQTELDALVTELASVTIPQPSRPAAPASQWDNERVFQAWAAEVGRDAVEGLRNDTIFHIACEGHGRGLSEAFVLSVCTQHCNGLSSAEVGRTVRSAFSQERTPNPPRAAAPKTEAQCEPADEEPTIADYHEADALVTRWQDAGETSESILTKCAERGVKATVASYILHARFALPRDETERLYRAAKKAAPPAAPHTQAAAENRAHILAIHDLLHFDATNDAGCLLGHRWLYSGQPCLWIGNTGIGKSALIIQAAITWAAGESFFGIEPTRALKSLILNGENGDADLAEMCKGVVSGLGYGVSKLRNMITVVTEAAISGRDFHPWARLLIQRFTPDLVFVDPLFSFLGADANSQESVSAFLRNGLGAIAAESGVIFHVVHHCPKPRDLELERKSLEFAYAGHGSAEFANWARAVLSLRETEPGLFELRASKRGTRAGLVDGQGKPATEIYLRHSRAGICWERSAAPENERAEGEEADAALIIAAMEPGRGYTGNGLIELAMDRLKLKSRANFTSPGKRGARILKIVKERTQKFGTTWLVQKTQVDTQALLGGVQ